MSNISRTDWSRIDAMTDEEIDTSDIPPLSDEFFLKAKLRMPSSLATATVAIRIDSETLAWFQSKGEKAERASRGCSCKLSKTPEADAPAWSCPGIAPAQGACVDGQRPI